MVGDEGRGRNCAREGVTRGRGVDSEDRSMYDLEANEINLKLIVNLLKVM